MLSKYVTSWGGCKLHIGSNLPLKDNLRKEDKSSAPKVSFIRRFQCIATVTLSLPNSFPVLQVYCPSWSAVAFERVRTEEELVVSTDVRADRGVQNHYAGGRRELVSWEHAACPLSGIKKCPLMGGWINTSSVVLSFGATASVLYRGVVRLWEGSLWEVLL